MSNYLFAIGKEKDLNILKSSFELAEDDTVSEITLKHISKRNWVLTIEKTNSHIKSSISEQCRPYTGVFFKGWFEDHAEPSIVIGKSGIEKYHSSLKVPTLFSKPLDKEGAFILASWTKKAAIVQNDLYSSFPIVFCNTNRIFLASDSLLLVSHCRKALRIPCKLNERVAIGKAWRTHGIASAPLCNETIIQGVEILSPGKHLEVQLDRKISLKTIHRPLREIFCNSKTLYNENLLQTINHMAASIYNIAILNNTKLEFGLSGGLDSRVILGVCLQSEQIMKSLYIQTSTQSTRSNDFNVVKSLSEKFDFEFNNIKQKKQVAEDTNSTEKQVANPLGLWALANLGLYDSVFLVKKIWDKPTTVRIGGQGAETVKDMWGGHTIDSLISKGVRDDVRISIRSQMQDALLSSGIDPLDEDAVKWHHLAYKSALHNGRFVTQSSLALRPFLKRDIFSIYNSPDNPFIGTGRDSPTICHDLLLLLDEQLALHEYDSASKNISQEYAGNRIAELSIDKPILFENPYKIFGSVLDITNGPPDCFLNLVENFSLNGLTEREKLKQMTADNWNVVQQLGMGAPYKFVYSQGIEKLEDLSDELSFSGTYAARICAFILIDKPSKKTIKKNTKKAVKKRSHWIIRYLRWRYKKLKYLIKNKLPIFQILR